MGLQSIPSITNSYVVDVTPLLVSTQKKHLADIAHDLQLIKAAEPHIDQLVLRGGGAVDSINNQQPNDYDLFYTYQVGNEYVTTCVCDTIREKLHDIQFNYFTQDKIDLENCLEKEPYATPIERTCGLISYHTSYYNMFCIDEQGRAWTNTDSWQHFLGQVYEVRTAGFLPWAYYPRSTDSQNFYAFYTYEALRGIGSILQRKLVCGPHFRQTLEYLPYFVSSVPEVQFPKLLETSKGKIGVDKLDSVMHLIDTLQFSSQTRTDLHKALQKILI